MARRTLLCCAYPFGYGPVAKLLHLAHRLRQRGWRLVFHGSGIAHELAARSTLFDDIVPTNGSMHGLLRSADGLLSLMDREHAALALELNRPLYVVDSLLWMRDQIPAVFRQARRYWVQSFVGVRERLPEAGPNAEVVGPIVAPTQDDPSVRDGPLVINLGGCETPFSQAGEDFTYGDFVCRTLVAGGLLDRQAAVLLAGERCIRYLKARYGGCGLEMRTAAHDDMLTLLRGAPWVLTSPGLTTCLECFQQGVPTYFLPPQNYSQWWILKRLRELGLAPGSFHWEDIAPTDPLTERMAEAVRAPLVRQMIGSLAGNPRAGERLCHGLTSALAGDSPALAARQRKFFESLGPDGTAHIVNELCALC